MLTGSVVLSLSGRDKNRLLAVTGTDERYIYVCDGRERPLHNPKRKNPKHVQPTDICLSEVQLRSNKSLRRALATVKNESESRR